MQIFKSIEVIIMKLKSFPAAISICLLALVIGIAFNAPAEAQNTEKSLKTSKALAAVNTSNRPIKAGKIDYKEPVRQPKGCFLGNNFCETG